MNDARTEFFLGENKSLRRWVQELLQERDSLRQELSDLKDDINVSINYKSWNVSTPMESDDIRF